MGEAKEVYYMAPAVVVSQAKKLRDSELYEQALDLLNRNLVRFDVFPTHIDVQIPTERKKEIEAKKGQLVRGAIRRGKRAVR